MKGTLNSVLTTSFQTKTASPVDETVFAFLVICDFRKSISP